MRDFIKGRSPELKIQLFRYLISGGTAFVLDFSTLWFLTEIMNFHYLLSSIVANGIGLVVTYVFSIFWIFDNRTVKNWVIEFLIFIMIGVVGAGLTIFFMWTITELIGFHYLVSKVITVLLVSLFTFVLKKKILFK